MDVFFKLSENPLPVRFFTKPLILIVLALYYFANKKSRLKIDGFLVIGLLLFLAGDIFLMLYQVQLLYIFGLICFVFGKLFYCKRFSNNRDFDLTKLIPFLIIIFVYLVIIFIYVYDNLGNFFFPTLLYIFASTLLALFAFLRQGHVNKQSYYLVMIGVFFCISSDSIALLQSFYNPDLAYHEITTMLCYGLFQYFVILGLKEGKLLKEI